MHTKPNRFNRMEFTALEKLFRSTKRDPENMPLLAAMARALRRKSILAKRALSLPDWLETVRLNCMAGRAKTAGLAGA